MSEKTDPEVDRQLFHMSVGLLALIVLLSFGRGALIAGVFLILAVGTLLINLRVLGIQIPIIRLFEKKFERKNVIFPGWGSACYAAGVLLLATVLANPQAIAAGITILAFGDSFSTILGRRIGTHKLPYNDKKTYEGVLAFIIFSLPAYFFIGPLTIPLAFVAALVETLPNLEDNLTIPVACTVFLLVV